jgi:hypothetical protein
LKQNFEPTAPAREQPVSLKEKNNLSGKFASQSGHNTEDIGKTMKLCVACHYWDFPSNVFVLCKHLISSELVSHKILVITDQINEILSYYNSSACYGEVRSNSNNNEYGHRNFLRE